MRRAVVAAVAFAVVLGGFSLGSKAEQAPPAGNPPPAPQGGGRAGGLGATFGLGGWVEAPTPNKKVVLAWADRGTTRGHSATSHALAVIERLGYESGLWETEIQTGSHFITLGNPAAANAAGRGGGGGGGFDLRNVDAIFAMGGRPVNLTDQQKADLLQFVRDGGGFVGSHGALIQFSEAWPEYKEMLNGFHDGHPFNGAQTPGYLINEDPSNPIVRHIPSNWLFFDEYYMIRDFDRSKIRVLLRHDVSKAPEIHAFRREDNDYPVAWMRNYGRGRVFYSTIAHGFDGWDNSNVQRMYLEALKWATGQSEVDATPRPMPSPQKPPATPAVPRGGPNPAAPPCAPDQVVTAYGQPYCFEGPLPRGANHSGGRGVVNTAPANGARGRGGN